MVASPIDLPRLDVEHEKRLVEEAIKVLQTRGLVELTWLKDQTWSALQEAMWGGPWHIFHFVGHGDFDRNRGEGRVAFPDETGRQVVLLARHLARLLDNHPDLRLVFLNSCEGARGSEGDPFSGTAATLVRRGVPAVVAMQYEITDNAAIEFSRAFYHAVANNLPVDAAVAAARTAVSINDTLEWGTPVLYMRSPNGQLFDLKKEVGKEEVALRKYREHVQTFWTIGEVHAREAERLNNLAHNELKLDPSTAGDIEREVMGETKEALLERQEQAAKEQYRKAVEAASTDNKLSDADAERLGTLASELGLSRDTAADIEREVAGDIVLAILQRQPGEESSRRYREAVELFWTDEKFTERDVGRLRNLADRLKVDTSSAAAIERDVMGASKEESLEREHEREVGALYEQGQHYLDAEDWAQAIGSLDQVHRLQPDFAEAWALKATALNRLDRYQEAIGACEKAISLKPEYELAWKNKGLALDNLGRYQEALEAYEKAISLKPDDANAWHNKGLALYNLRRPHEAIAVYDKAISLKPDYDLAKRNRELARYRLRPS